MSPVATWLSSFALLLVDGLIRDFDPLAAVEGDAIDSIITGYRCLMSPFWVAEELAATVDPPFEDGLPATPPFG
jgi:hypothetical protein